MLCRQPGPIQLFRTVGSRNPCVRLHRVILTTLLLASHTVEVVPVSAPVPGHVKNYCKPQTIATLAEPRSGPTMIGPWRGDDASRAVNKDAPVGRTPRRSAIGAGYVATVICRVSAAIRVQDDRPSR
jgi:hypothetical protein